jgi:hypothetical protein
MKRLLVLALLIMVAVAPAADAKQRTYGKSSYRDGPSGGDGENYIRRDRSLAWITVVRANPVAGAFNCSGTGGFATFDLTHVARSPVKSVVLSYSDSVLDSFTWMKLSVLVRGMYVGTVSARGPVAGNGTLVFRMLKALPAGRAYTIRFGLEVASACPNVDGGSAMFPAVSVIS